MQGVLRAPSDVETSQSLSDIWREPKMVLNGVQFRRAAISNLSSVNSGDDDRGVDSPFVCARRQRVDTVGAAIFRFHVAASSARSDEAGNGSFDVRGGEELEE